MPACNKRRYRTEIQAKLVLATIQHKDSPRRPKQEQRTYHCPLCHGWHLTARPSRKVGV